MFRGLFASAFLLLVPAVSVSAGDDVGRLLRRFGFEADAAVELREGEIIHEDLEATNDRELGVVVAAFVPMTVDEVAATFGEGRHFALDETPGGARPIDPADPETSFAAARYSADEADEMADLLEAEAGDDFNLSAAEIAAWRTLARELEPRRPEKDAAARRAVSRLLRAQLLTRYRACRAGGIAALEPYAREDDAFRSPSAELARAAKTDRVDAPGLPALLDELAADGDGLDGSYFWLKREVNDRPAFVIVHLAIRRAGETLVVVERHLHASHSYNTYHAVRVAVPVAGGVVLIARCRTSTDEIEGFGTSMKRRLGRRQMRKSLVEHFEGLREVARTRAGTRGQGQEGDGAP